MKYSDKTMVHAIMWYKGISDEWMANSILEDLKEYSPKTITKVVTEYRNYLNEKYSY